MPSAQQNSISGTNRQKPKGRLNPLPKRQQRQRRLRMDFGDAIYLSVL